MSNTFHFICEGNQINKSVFEERICFLKNNIDANIKNISEWIDFYEGLKPHLEEIDDILQKREYELAKEKTKSLEARYPGFKINIEQLIETKKQNPKELFVKIVITVLVIAFVLIVAYSNMVRQK